jgi:hypothetical protein
VVSPGFLPSSVDPRSRFPVTGTNAAMRNSMQNMTPTSFFSISSSFFQIKQIDKEYIKYLDLNVWDKIKTGKKPVFLC